MGTLTYTQAGVDIEAGDRLVKKISQMVRGTLNSRVKNSIGGYASLYALDSKNWIAASTDGVGTKLKLAFERGVHHTVGIDLVAMCVNDLLCVGAEPLFFLDYFATGKLHTEVAEKVLSGVVQGCLEARSALVGGETAEMPDMYQRGEYDLAGFAVGKVSKQKLLPKTQIRSGDVLIGLPSSGTHSNGYSLLRKLLPDSGEERVKLIDELLTPTRIYVEPLLPLIQAGLLKGMAHLTGSGILNLPRVSDQVSYRLKWPSDSEIAPIYSWVKKASGLSFQERLCTFNCGVGMILVVAKSKVPQVLKKLKKEKTWILGEVVPKKTRSSQIWVENPEGEKAEISY